MRAERAAAVGAGGGRAAPGGGQAAPGAARGGARGRRVTAAASPQRRAEPPHLGAGGQPDGGPQPPPTMNTIVFSKLSGQVLFEEDAKERERGGRPYVGVVEGPHHAEVLLPDSPSIKESLSLRNRRTGYAPRSAPARVGVAGEGGGSHGLPSPPPRRSRVSPGGKFCRWLMQNRPSCRNASVRRRATASPGSGTTRAGRSAVPFARALRVTKPPNGAARLTAASPGAALCWTRGGAGPRDPLAPLRCRRARGARSRRGEKGVAGVGALPEWVFKAE